VHGRHRRGRCVRKGCRIAKKAKKRTSAAKAKPAGSKKTEPAIPEKTPARKGGRTPSPDKQRAFLKVFAETASVTDAARAARIHRTQHYRWLEVSREYAAEFQKIVQVAAGAVEDEIVRRAMKGVFEPNVFQGRFVYPQQEYVVKEAVIGPRGAIREPEVRGWRDKPGAKPLGIYRKSDSLIALLARAWLPHKYRPQLELSGPEGGPLEIVERLHAGRERARKAAALERENSDAAGR
jgi:hypothetical protein